MRKIIIEMNPRLVKTVMKNTFFESLCYIEGKALLTFDIERGVKIGICDIKMKDSFTFEDFQIPPGFEILNILREEGTKYTCLVKIEYQKNLMKLVKLFHVDNIIYDLPFYISEEKIVFAFIAESEALKKMLKIIKPLGLVRTISFQKVTAPEYNALSCLTGRQSEIILAAKKHGYYEYPRKITPEELSRRLGISKATTIEHLRKAENRIMSHITAGY
jgi:predicted DNA binding protein